jgi:hypothetical protein
MQHQLRHRRSQAQALMPAPTRPTAERIPSLALALAFVGSLGLSALTANRIARVQHDFKPALEATRQLGVSLEAARALLTDTRLGPIDSRIVRADSQALRFHRIATVAARGAPADARMLAYSDAFTSYYVAARRAAVGLSLSAEPDGKSAEDAALGYRLLREDLAVGRDAQFRAVEAARPATAPVELAAWLTLGLIAGGLLLRRAMGVDVEWPIAAQLATRIQRAKAVDAPAAAVVPLHEAVERLARQRLAASVAAARVAKRNNERQIEVARSWIAPALSIVRDEPPRAEMDVYEDDAAADDPRFGGLALVPA